MNFLLFCARDTQKAVHACRRNVFIIFLSVTVTFAALLVLLRIFLFSSTYITEAQNHKKTYAVSISIQPETTKQLHDTQYSFIKAVLDGSYTPEVKSIKGVYVRAMLEIPGGITSFYAEVLPEQPKIDCISSEIELTSGRLFGETELANGENVVIASSSDPLFRGCRPGETVKIGEKEYTVVGICKNPTSLVPFSSTESNTGWSYDINEITFKSKLSSADKKLFLSAVSEMGGEAQSLFEKQSLGFFMNMLLNFIVVTLVMFCCMSVVASLFFHMVKSRTYEFNIYKLCGIDKRQLMGVFYSPLVSLFTVACACGLLIFKLSMPFQNALRIKGSLPWWVILLCLLLFAAVLAVTVEPVKRRLLLSPPTQEV